MANRSTINNKLALLAISIPTAPRKARQHQEKRLPGGMGKDLTATKVEQQQERLELELEGQSQQQDLDSKRKFTIKKMIATTREQQHGKSKEDCSRQQDGSKSMTGNEEE
jgi:hypothetical protein